MPPSNLLLLTVDCLRYDSCGFNGYHRPTTPNLDRLAAHDGTIFDNAYATGPWTPESFPGILAGRLSKDTACYEKPAWKALPDDSPTLATWLRDAGYETHARISNPHLSTSRNFDRGFDSFENLRINRLGEKFTADESDDSGGGGSQPNVVSHARNLLRTAQDYNVPFAQTLPTVAYRLKQLRGGDWPTTPAEDVIDSLIECLDTTSQPAFAWTHLMDLHAPIHPHRARKGGLLPSDSTVRQFAWDADRLVNKPSPGYRAMYDSTLRYIDREIGRLIDWLKKTGQWDETVLVVTADHGEALHDRGVYGHAAGRDMFAYESDRHYVYDELLHVPLLVSGTGSGTGRQSGVFSLGWLGELIAELVGEDAPLVPMTSDRGSHLNGDSDSEVVVSDAVSSEGQTIAVRDSNRKLMTECLANGETDFEGARVYAATDSGERHPLPESPPSRLTNAATNAVTQPDALSEVGRVDRETEELLADLGYR